MSSAVSSGRMSITGTPARSKQVAQVRVDRVQKWHRHHRPPLSINDQAIHDVFGVLRRILRSSMCASGTRSTT